jgi:hypothetical protein
MFLSITNIGSSTFVLTYSGNPNSSYVLEMTTNLLPPVAWTLVATNTADANGLVEFTNQKHGPAAFWRAYLLP